MVEIPDLSETPFDAVTFSLWIDGETLLERMGGDSYSEWLLHDGPYVSALNSARNEESEVTTFAQLTSWPIGDEVTPGVHVELKLQTSPFTRSSTAESEFRKRESSVASIATALSNYCNYLAVIQVDASYLISRDELPRQGIVASMLGLQTTVAGEQLLVTGANFMLRGFPDDSVSWFASDDKVRGIISRRTREVIRNSTLKDSLYVATTRFQRLILEQLAPSSHAFSSSVS